MVEKKKHSKAIFRKFSYAFRGLFISLKEEKSLVIHFIFATLSIIIGIILQLAPVSWAVLILTVGLVVSSELMNTAIENVVDMVAFKYNFNAKKIKDIAAAATLVLAVVAIIVGLLLFIPRIVTFIQHGYGYGGWA